MEAIYAAFIMRMGGEKINGLELRDLIKALESNSDHGDCEGSVDAVLSTNVGPSSFAASADTEIVWASSLYTML
jgi:hypothetical protein